MLYYVPRNCKLTSETPSEEIHHIEHFRALNAYVLLAEPGAGKSSLFQAEAKNTGNGLYISARDFIDLDREAWRDKTLFIDGLDEARAGKDDARTPLGAIRSKLDKLGCQRFRISCREADWLGTADAKDLAKISPNHEITILHLNPLSDDDIKQILHHDQRVPEPDAFIEKANQFSLSGLLNNPQTLDMLIDATKGGHEWPTSKQQVYELACQQLASEFNDEHAVAQREKANTSQLIEAAGLLCAIQIIANVSAFSNCQGSKGRIGLHDLSIPDQLPIGLTLKTRLFIKTSNGEFSYVHRSVAEYLAAKFLAKKIAQGLLFNRVLALNSGFDGGIVAALRGLMAWLSVLSPQAREHLIEIDPVGIIINGDASQFPRQAKSQLYGALIRESQTTGFPNRDWYSYAFSAITTADMVTELSEILNRPCRNDGEQFLLHCLLKGLACSESIVEIKAPLLKIIRDNSYWEGMRSNALDAFIHQYPADLDSLLSLADEIRQGKIEDTENTLMALLLDKLFPAKIPATSLFEYLLPPKHNFDFHYHYFWQTTFTERLTDIDIVTVLDQLFELGSDFLDRFPQDVIEDIAGPLLIRGLLTHGLNISGEKLFNWLSIGIDQYDSSVVPIEQRQQIASWLGAHSDRYLAALSEGLKRIKKAENINWKIHTILTRLYDATPPNNFAQWWLNQALAETDFKLSCAYFEQAFVQLYSKLNDDNYLTLDYFVNWLTVHPEYLETYQSLTYYVIPDGLFEHKKSRKTWTNKRDEEQRNGLTYLLEQKVQIAEGSAAPQIFYHLASAFDHRSRINGKTREERLSEFLNGNEILITAAKTGLRKILQRTDLPSPAEVFTATKKGEFHYLRLPFLVCLDTLYQENPAMLESLSDDLLGKALAYCFTEGATNEIWLKALCESKPELVSRLFIDYATAAFAAKSAFINGLYNVSYDPDFREIATQTVMPLLKQYPVRGYKNHILHLHFLLDAAIKNIEKQVLLTLIDKKLLCKGMDLAQRIYWFATGLIIAPEEYEAKIKQVVVGNSLRINHLSQFLYPGFASKMYDRYAFPVSTKGLLIELLAPRCTPAWPRGSGAVTRAMEERDYVRFLLDSLADNPGEDSAAILTDLLKQSKLSAWHTQIQIAQQTQRLSRREALFKHPNAQQVINTLSDSKPANVADLAVLTLDCLTQLALEMHGSNTDSFKQFWNVDSYEKPVIPRTENLCRDYLVERLKPLLTKYDVQVDLEAHQAKDKRADMKIAFTSQGKTFHLPIEIKRDYHPALWRTIREQLIPLYTIAPETEGRGVFLVIWFNYEKLPTHPLGLLPPKSAEQLAAMLTETMTPAEKKLIDVFVLDVSKK